MSIALLARGHHVVTDPSGEVIEGILFNDPEVARQAAETRIGVAWDSLYDDGFRVKMSEIWSV